MSGSEVETLAGNNPASGAPARAPAALKRGDTVDRYLIVGEIGGGSMGVVYNAYDTKLDRRVALKVLRPGIDRGRQLTEARTMAKLSHRNVVAVHDAGEYGDQVFIAMEFIEGATLRVWRRQTKPDWRQVLAMFVQAGRGLAAAHAAGIVHRDFKPDNVLVDAIGSARVLDFGLAQLAGAELATREMQLGTPAYMAPEQHTAGTADVQADLFSFCVALFEGLYGVRPFRGGNTAELGLQMLRGRVVDPPPDARVPRWLHRVVTRGLSAKASERPASMDALLAILERGPGRRNRRLAFGVGIVALGAAVWAWPAAPAADASCTEATVAFAPAWDAAHRERIRAALTASGKSYAAEAWSRAQSALDTYARDWTNTVEAACTARRQGGTAAQLQRRLACLEERRWRFVAVVDVLAQPDDSATGSALQAARTLPAPAACLEAELGPRYEPLPEDPARVAAIDAVERDLDRAEALEAAGRFAESLVLADPARVAAQATEHGPTLARADLVLGWARYRAGNYEAAADALRQSHFAALRAGLDELAVLSAARLPVVLGEHLHRPAEASAWLRHARVVLDEIDRPPPLIEASVGFAQIAVLKAEGKLAEARDALVDYHDAVAQSLGADHPMAAGALSNLAQFSLYLGDPGADAWVAQAIAAMETTYGNDHPHVAHALLGLGVLDAERGDAVAAQRAIRRALTIREQAYGPTHRLTVAVLQVLARVQVETLDLEKARATLKDAERRAPPGHGAWAEIQSGLALVDLESGNPGSAQARAAAGLEQLRPRSGASPRAQALCRGRVGQALVEQGELAEATPHLRAAAEFLEQATTDGEELALVRFASARAMHDADPGAAVAQARAARDGLAEAVTPRLRAHAHSIDTWLAERDAQYSHSPQ